MPKAYTSLTFLIPIFLLLNPVNGYTQTCKAKLKVTNSHLSCPPPGGINITNTSTTGLNPLLSAFYFNGVKIDSSYGKTSYKVFPSEPGIYSAYLHVVSSDGLCRDSVYYDRFLVIDGPSATISQLPDTVSCAPLTANIQVTTAGAISATLIYGSNTGFNFFDNLRYHDTITVDHIYPNIGTFSYNLVVSDSAGCNVGYYSKNTTLKKCIDTCNAGFYTNSQFLSCPPFPVQFFNSNEGTGELSLWNLGDGSTAETDNPLHVYFSPGRYTVSHIVETNSGCRDTVTYPDFIQVGGPTGRFTLEPDTGCKQLSVSLTGAVSAVSSITMDFGDGFFTSNIISGTHLYTSPGQYFPVCTLVDTLGCTVAYLVDTVVVLLECNPLGIEEEAANGTSLAIYPVPAENYVIITVPVYSSVPVSLSVYNMLGQVVHTQPVLTTAPIQLNISTYPEGIYTVLLQQHNQLLSKGKFMKQ